MARRLRIGLAGGLYHVTARGDRREAIYLDDEVWKNWLELFAEVCERFYWRCHAYGVMHVRSAVTVVIDSGRLYAGWYYSTVTRVVSD